jgi:two-component system, sensor histidine kinase LadS
MRKLSFIILFLSFQNLVLGQKVVSINDSTEHYIFTFDDIDYREDIHNNLDIEEVSAPESQSLFSTNNLFNPENLNKDNSYWYRIKIRQNKNSKNRWLLEFYDQTIDHIEFYTPKNGYFEKKTLGDLQPFSERSIRHKNFIVNLPNDTDGTVTYYFKLRSAQKADVIVVLRSVNWFVSYALNEYYFFGIFYGMILVFCLYNFLMYLAVREAHYAYYILYLIGIGLYEMCADGIAYQYLWPDAVNWNQQAVGYALFFASTCMMLFTINLLNLRKQTEVLYRLMLGVIIVRTGFFLACVFNPELFSFRIIEFGPIIASLYCGIRMFYKGYRPARFLVIGHGFLFIGMTIKILNLLNIGAPFVSALPLAHYSLSFCFVMEMMFLSFAIGDKIRVMRKEQHESQELIIEQLHENHRLKDEMNSNLEEQVKLKTHELIEKSEHIEEQNHKLSLAYQKLEHQAEKIAAMNYMLTKDNVQLKEDVAKVTEARIMSKDVTFEEFSAMYPDDISCMKFLSELKWPHEYVCRNCGNTTYGKGKSHYSRRCSKCGYDESVTSFTILQNTRLPINKAFYMLFLLYSTKGAISSHKLSDILDIRQSTCWAYSSRIKKVIKEKNRKGKLHEGWSDLVLEIAD